MDKNSRVPFVKRFTVTLCTTRWAGLLACLLASFLPALPGRDGGEVDLVVYGATPGGVACAVRAAREGLTVHLVSPYEHIGGMLSNGLSTMDTLYNGRRAPLYDELRESIYAYYRIEYGADSPQFEATQPGHPKTRYEAHVVERLIDEMVSRESGLSLTKGYYPIAVNKNGTFLSSVTFREVRGEKTLMVSGEAFADCSYEADLAAVAGVPYRVGREARDEFNEKHAGEIYLRRADWPPTIVATKDWAIARTLNLFRYSEWYEVIGESSTGNAHPSVQGYNMRTIITRDPTNRIPIKRPPDYDPEPWRKYGFGRPEHPGLSMPNRKFGMNEPKLVGRQDPFVEGDWERREAVAEEHRQATLSLLYFRQHDPSVPEAIRKKWLEFGLPKDEFVDNGHMPKEIYARETRRIQGRKVFTQNDAQLAPDLDRAPVHWDSISITEWFLDSHACTPREVTGSEMEGKVMLKNQTFPGQVSYRTLLPEGFDNFMAPVCLSSTHVGWGTIRLEPTWMSIGEAAAYAVAQSKEENLALPDIDMDKYLRSLAEHRFLLSFFNDVEGHEDAKWFPAIQYLGAQGFFGSYDAKPFDTLKEPLASRWIEQTEELLRGSRPNATGVARTNLAAENMAGLPVTAHAFALRLFEALGDDKKDREEIVDLLDQWEIPSGKPVSRGNACRLIYRILK